MPATALPDQHLEGMEDIEDALADLQRVIAESTADGKVDADERRAIGDALQLAFDYLRREQMTATEIACTSRVIRALTRTFGLTPKVKHLAKAAEEDIERLVADHARRRQRRWTPTGTYLELVKGGGDGDDLSAA